MSVDKRGYEQVPNQSQQNLNEINQQSSLKKSATNLLGLVLAIFVIILVFKCTSNIYTLSGKQSQMKQLLSIYRQALSIIQDKVKNFNLKNGLLLTDKENQQYGSLIKQIKEIQSIIGGKIINDKQDNKQLNGVAVNLQKLQSELQQRGMLLNMLNSHSKQQVRKRKIEMMQTIGKKDSFSKQQKIRNPWAMSKLNLRTPFIDTLQRRHMQQQIQKQSDRLQQKYHLSTIKKQLPLCIIVTGRNNAVNYRYQYNLQSIKNQQYQNYKLIITDDASDDGSQQLIQIFLKKTFHKNKYYFIKNKQRMTAVYNINYSIKNYCNKNDIAILISGDDQLLGKKVFQIINSVYQTKKPGVAYTNHFYGKLHQNDFQIGYSKPYTFSQIKNKLYRFVGQNFGHMRTFLVSLFLQIKQQHMKYKDGRWIDATYDQTFLIPMLEMSCDSIQYIDEYVYLYNYGTGNNDGEIRHDIQSSAALYARQLPRYGCIQKFQKYII